MFDCKGNFEFFVDASGVSVIVRRTVGFDALSKSQLGL